MSPTTASKPNIRRIPIFASLALALVGLVLAGCGGSKSSSPNAGTTAATTTAATETAPSTETASKGESSSGGSEGASSLKLAANPEGQLAYNTKSLSAKAGKVTIAFENSSPVSHNVTIESSAGKIVGATPSFQGGSKTLSVNLPPGTYKFFCSVPGHRQAGMEGTLVVK